MTLIIPEMLGIHQERHLRRSFIGDDGVRWIRCPGTLFDQTRLTAPHLAPLYKIAGWVTNNPNGICYECHRILARNRNQIGHEQREKIFLRAGGCEWFENGIRCIMRYPEHLRGNFALDHIDPKMKQKNDLMPGWIAGHVDEFWSRVAPNVQVLCQHHNGIKSVQQFGVGGELHVDPWLQDYAEELIPPDENQLSLFDEDLLT